MRRMLPFISAVLLVGSLLPAAAKTVFPTQGGTGDIANGTACGKGEFIVGFKGRVGSWIDRIQPICAKVLASGGLGKKNYGAGAFGGGGGSPAEVSCPPGMVIKSIKFGTTKESRQVEWVNFFCTSPSTGETRNVPESFEGAPSGASGQSFAHFCPDGEAAKGMNVRWGAHVNAIGLICTRLVVPNAPAQNNTPQSATSGTAPATPAPDPYAPNLASPAGVWDMENSAGDRFTFIVEVNGDTVSGHMGHNQAQFDGSFQGPFDAGLRTFVVSYAQPQAGTTGRAKFTMSGNGMDMAGYSVPDQDTTKRIQWTGRRRS